MKFSSVKAGATPEILKRKLGAEYSKPITVYSTAFGTAGVVKAGTPLDKDGKIANTSAAVGLLWNDVYEENPNGALLVGDAVINKANAEANSKLTLATAAITALSHLIFE